MVNNILDTRACSTTPKSQQQKATKTNNDSAGTTEKTPVQDTVSISEGALNRKQAAYSNAYGIHNQALEALHSDENGKPKEDGLEKILEYYATQMDNLSEMEDGEDKELATRALDDAVKYAVASFSFNATPRDIDSSWVKIADGPIDFVEKPLPEIVDGIYTLNQKATATYRAQSLTEAFMAATRQGSISEEGYMGLFHEFISRNTSEEYGEGSELRLSNINRYVEEEKKNKIPNDQKDTFTTKEDTKNALNAYKAAMDYYSEN